MIFKLPPKLRTDKAWSLTDREKDALDYSLVINKPRDEIYNIFCAPQLTRAQCRARASALWSSKDATEYMELRTRQIEDSLPSRSKSGEQSGEAFSEEFALTLKKLIADKALDANSQDQWDAVKLAAQQVFKETTISFESPRRYLPESCYSGPCRYLAYCELALSDECQYCRYKKYAEEHGVMYDHQNMLDIPQDNPIRKGFDGEEEDDEEKDEDDE